jgi:hypothetical protein
MEFLIGVGTTLFIALISFLIKSKYELYYHNPKLKFKAHTYLGNSYPPEGNNRTYNILIQIKLYNVSKFSAVDIKTSSISHSSELSVRESVYNKDFLTLDAHTATLLHTVEFWFTLDRRGNEIASYMEMYNEKIKDKRITIIISYYNEKGRLLYLKDTIKPSKQDLRVYFSSIHLNEMERHSNISTYKP